MNVIKAIFIVIIGVIVIMVTGFQAIMGLFVYGVTSSYEDSQKKSASLKGMEIRGLEDYRKKASYIALTEPGSFSNDRFIRVTEDYRIKDLVNPGEEMPSEEFIEAFASLRAGQLSQEECEILKQDLASDCKVAEAKGSHRKGIITIAYAMTFTPKSEFGEVKSTRAGVFSQSQKTLMEQSMNPAGPGTIRKLRQAQYAKMVSSCEQIKQKIGNCGVGRGDFRASLATGSSALKTKAHATFSHIAPL
jgi:hypothetical protein